MAKNTREVSIAEVRKAFAKGGPLDPKTVTIRKGGKDVPAPTASLFGKDGTRAKPGVVRGRLHPAFREAFEAANPGTVVREKIRAAEPTVMVPRTGANGKSLKPVEAKVADVRKVANQPKGRLSNASLKAYADHLAAQSKPRTRKAAAKPAEQAPVEESTPEA